MEQGRLPEADEINTRALLGYEEALGTSHTSTLAAICSLGILYRKQGKLNDAEDMFVRALKGYEKTLGSKHTSTLDALHCLGILYMEQGRLPEAEEINMRALKGYEEVLGSKHTSTLLAINNLAKLYRKQDKLKEAEEMFMRARLLSVIMKLAWPFYGSGFAFLLRQTASQFMTLGRPVINDISFVQARHILRTSPLVSPSTTETKLESTH
jgi:tetratricopeptide (TPR) repeat protein